MVFDKLFLQNNILETAMQATEYKNETLLNNIANADTPNFKAKDVKFNDILENAIENYEMTGEFDIDSVKAELYTKHRNYSVRIDGNNVDVETELVNFYKNSSKYDVIVNSVLNNSGRMNTVYTNMK